MTDDGDHRFQILVVRSIGEAGVGHDGNETEVAVREVGNAEVVPLEEAIWCQDRISLR